MKLYDLAWGPWCRRVTIYLKEKGITDVEIVPLKYGDEQLPHLLQKNPLSYIPFLELDDGRVVIDSLAIMGYLEEQYPTPNFVGRDSVERARSAAFVNTVNEVSYNSKYVHSNTVREYGRFLTQSKETAEWVQPFLDRSIDALEALTDNNGPFLLGDRVTMADCALYPLIHFGALYDVVYFNERHPKLQRWFSMFAQRPSAPCPLRDDGLLPTDPDDPPPGTYWWQKPKPALARLKK